MTILDTIRFPVHSIDDARDVWPNLPREVKNKYRAWWNATSVKARPTEDEQNECLRKLIQEHE